MNKNHLPRIISLLSLTTLLSSAPLHADGLVEYPSYGFNFVNFTDNSVENDGLFGWTTSGDVTLIAQNDGDDSFLRLKSNSSSQVTAEYSDFGYFRPNESDFTMIIKLRILDFLPSESKQSTLTVTVGTGSTALELGFRKNGIYCRNSSNNWKKVSSFVSNAYETFSFIVKDGVLEEIMINGETEASPSLTLTSSDAESIRIRALGRSDTTNFNADIDELFVYSMPSHLNLCESTGAPYDPEGSGKATHFMHLGLDDSGIPIGVNEDGGGYITQIYNNSDGVNIEDSSDLGDVLDPQPQFGAGSNQSVRGFMHTNSYNPVQAGISKWIGHSVDITRLKSNGTEASTSSDTKTLVVEQFPTYNDPSTNYAENTSFDFDINGVQTSLIPEANLEADDGIDESAISATEEGMTELDFCGYFQDETASSDGTPTMLSYGEWKYVRPPCHILQLSREAGAIRKNFTPRQISTEEDRSELKTRDTDLGSMRVMREVRANSDLGYTWVHWKENGVRKKIELTSSLRDNDGTQTSFIDFECFDQSSTEIMPDNNVVILAKSSSWNGSGAVGVYYPDTEVNEKGTVGYDRATDAYVYSEDRRTSIEIRADWVKLNWVRIRLLVYSRGLFSPSRVDDVYESLRSENYTIFGTPSEIFDKATSLAN